MNLDFSDEQEALRGLVRELCRDHAPIDVVRAMEDDPRGYAEAFWKQLAALACGFWESPATRAPSSSRWTRFTLSRHSSASKRSAVFCWNWRIRM